MTIIRQLRRFTTALPALLLFTHQLLAGGSVFSSFGVGTIRFNPNVRSIGMGGTAIAVPSFININRLNPAGLIGINTTVFEGSLFYEGVTIKTEETADYSSTGNVFDAQLAIPFGNRLTVAIGLAPFSDVQYSFTTTGKKQGGFNYDESRKGKGGLSETHISVGFKPSKKLSLGLASRFMFGNIDHRITGVFDTSGFSDFSILQKNKFSGFQLVPGFIYNEGKISVGAFTEIPLSMSLETEQITAYDTLSDAGKQDVDFPVRIGIGGSYKMKEKYLFNADLIYSNWSSFKVAGKKPGNLRDSFRFGLGAEILGANVADLGIPYYKKVAYRAGLYYEALYAESVTGKPVNEYALTAGMGFPFNRGWNNCDLSFEVGKRGSIDQNLASETIYRLTISISAAQRWFVRRKVR